MTQTAGGEQRDEVGKEPVAAPASRNERFWWLARVLSLLLLVAALFVPWMRWDETGLAYMADIASAPPPFPLLLIPVVAVYLLGAALLLPVRLPPSAGRLLSWAYLLALCLALLGGMLFAGMLVNALFLTLGEQGIPGVSCPPFLLGVSLALVVEIREARRGRSAGLKTPRQEPAPLHDYGGENIPQTADGERQEEVEIEPAAAPTAESERFWLLARVLSLLLMAAMVVWVAYSNWLSFSLSTYVSETTEWLGVGYALLGLTILEAYCGMYLAMLLTGTVLLMPIRFRPQTRQALSVFYMILLAETGWFSIFGLDGPHSVQTIFFIFGAVLALVVEARALSRMSGNGRTLIKKARQLRWGGWRP